MQNSVTVEQIAIDKVKKDAGINVVVTEKVFGETNKRIRKASAKRLTLGKKLQRSVSNTGYILVALAYGASAGINAGFNMFATTVAALYKGRFVAHRTK